MIVPASVSLQLCPFGGAVIYLYVLHNAENTLSHKGAAIPSYKIINIVYKMMQF